jgi:hypothetical protein
MEKRLVKEGISWKGWRECSLRKLYTTGDEGTGEELKTG